MPNLPCTPDPRPDPLLNDQIFGAPRRAPVRNGVSRLDYREVARGPAGRSTGPGLNPSSAEGSGLRRFVSDPALRAFAILAIIAAAASPSALVP